MSGRLRFGAAGVFPPSELKCRFLLLEWLLHNEQMPVCAPVLVH
jgi:hypothetical protein